MRIVIECTSAFEAKKLKSQILEDVKNEELETWEHTTAQSGNDIIFHNPDQYVTEPKKMSYLVLTLMIIRSFSVQNTGLKIHNLQRK